MKKPMISIQKVGMDFKIPLESSSSLKEYLIQTLQGKKKYRTLKALDSITLDIYQGEVLGIIGTNGSGASVKIRLS